MKLQRDGSEDATTGASLPGEEIIEELLQKMIILFPIVIDPHGKWGPMFDSFLFDSRPRKDLIIPHDRPTARLMHHIASTHPCPTGIVNQATAQ